MKRKCTTLELLSISLLPLCLLLKSYYVQAQPTAIPSNAEPLILRTSVLDEKGRFLIGLQKELFTVFCDKAKREIVDFRVSDEPTSVVLLVDKTKSMNVDGWRAHQYSLLGRAFLEFMESSHVQNEYALLSFDKSSTVLQGWSTDQQAILAPLKNFTNEQAQGVMDVRQACLDALETAKTGKHPRKLIVLFTDGWQSAGTVSDKKFKELGSDSGVAIFAVKVPNLPFPGSGGVAEDLLNHIVSPTGGTTLFADSPLALLESFSSLNKILQNQYRITIHRPPFQKEKKWHSLKVDVVLPPGSLRALKSLGVKHQAGFFDRLK